MDFPILCDNPMGRSSSGVHYKYAKKDEKLPLKWRFSRIIDTTGQRLRTDFPEVRHFSVSVLLCGSRYQPPARRRCSRAHRATTAHIISDDVWTEKTGNSVETKSSRRFEIKGKHQIIMITASIYTVTTLLPLFLVRTCACCLLFRSVFYLWTAFYQPGCKSSASKGMTGPPSDNIASALYSMLGFSFNYTLWNN